MKTMVTGGTGILGSHIVEALVARGHEVRALVRRSSDTAHLRTTGAELVYGDVTDFDSLPPAAKGVDIVFHAAGRVTPGWGEWQDFESTIVKGTENLLKASASAGVSRFLHVSSCTVLGPLACSNTPADESLPCAIKFTPDTYYDYAKKLAEDLVLDYHRQGKLKASIIRPGMIYGPRDRLLTDRVYRHMSSRIIVWPGEANPRCSFVFASDVADLAILAATSPKAIGQIYNVAPPREVRFREFCACMIKAQGGSSHASHHPVRAGPVLVFLDGRMGETAARKGNAVLDSFGRPFPQRRCKPRWLESPQGTGMGAEGLHGGRHETLRPVASVVRSEVVRCS